MAVCAIHLDPEFAQFREYCTPIAHGVMTAVWLLGVINQPGAASELNATFAFHRPVFWDGARELWVGNAGSPCRYRSLNATGKMTAEMLVTKVVTT